MDVKRVAERGLGYAVALLATVLMASPARASESQSKRGHVTAELVCDVASLAPGASFSLGVRMRMEPGWHVYWREPGDAGLAPTFTWTLPSGFEVDPPSWPLPKWHKVGPLWTLIYEPEVLIAFRARAPDSLPELATLAVRVDWLVCHDAEGCKPGQAELSVRLREEFAASDRRAPDAAVFDEHWQRAPRPMPAQWVLSEDHTTLQLGGEGPWAIDDASFAFFPADFESFKRGADLHVERRGTRVTLGLPLIRSGAAPPRSTRGVLAITSGSDVRSFTVGWEDTAVPSSDEDETLEEVTVVLPPAAPESSVALDGDDLAWAHAYEHLDASAPEQESSWFWAVLLALCGGLILNLMPCVLPVLSLKVLGLIDQAQDSSVRARRHGYAFALGVIVSFLAVAGLLLALRAAGSEIGWGFQMQEPAVVAGLAILMLLLALNLFGVFEIGAGMTGLAGSGAGQGYVGSFATGILTTVVATPCTAPFMGTAIGYAMTQPAVLALSVFGALGVGMSAPYVVVAAFPKFLRWIPKPGPWMDTLRHILAFPLLATAIWLAWVFGRQMGGDSVPALLAALLLVAMSAWCFGRYAGAQRTGRTRWLVGRALALGLLVAGCMLALRVEPAVGGAPAVHGAWVPYDGYAIREHQSAGRPVFLDFTADWCLTCKANDAGTLQAKSVTDAFARHNVVPMLADWTRRDERITRALARLDRNSVPLYVIVPPDPSRPVVVLRTAITPNYVVSALRKTLR